MLVSFLARRIRALAGLQEMPKFTIVRTMELIHERMLLEGQKLVQAGAIDNATDLFLLHDDEMTALAKGELENCKALIQE